MSLGQQMHDRRLADKVTGEFPFNQLSHVW